MLLGLGAGIAFNPVLLAAMGDVAPSRSGLASGVVNTAFMMGGALGLAVLASLAAATDGFRTCQRRDARAALNAGYRTRVHARRDLRGGRRNHWRRVHAYARRS